MKARAAERAGRAQADGDEGGEEEEGAGAGVDASRASAISNVTHSAPAFAAGPPKLSTPRPRSGIS